QDDLKQLRGIRLENREKAYLLECFDAEVLSLVDNDDRVPSRATLFDQKSVQRDQPLRPRAAWVGHPQIGQGILEHFVERQRRVRDEGRVGAAVDALDERPEHGCLSRSDLARHQDETLLLLNTVNELGQRLPVIWREKEKFRVRRELERLA